MAAERDWIDRLQSFDRRWIFLAMALAVVLPLLYPLNLPIGASPMVKAAYYTVEELKEGDVVFLSIDLDPAAKPELEPFYRAVVLQLKRKNVKLVLATTWYAAPPLVEAWIADTIEQPIVRPGEEGGTGGPPDRAYVKNVDYVWLGFREGKQAVIANMGNDLRRTFDNRAADGTSLESIPLMKGIDSLDDFGLMVLVSAGFPGAKEYVQQVQSRYNLKMVAACTAVSTTDLSPYYDAGQLLGLIGGMAAAAEYESLVGKLGKAAKGTDVLNTGHIVVIFAIVFGNLIYFVGRSRARARGRR